MCDEKGFKLRVKGSVCSEFSLSSQEADRLFTNGLQPFRSFTSILI